jgi:salicylate hydroxylase
LHKLGLGEATNNIAGDRNGVWISFRRWDNGEDIVTVPVDDKKLVRQLPVQRSEFLNLLVDAVKERAAAMLHTNKRCRRLIVSVSALQPQSILNLLVDYLQEQGEEVLIEFDDGTNAAANLVVGCDGIHSTVRSQFVADNPTYSGRIAFRGLVPISSLESFWPLPTYSASWLGKDKHCLMFPISRNKTLNIVAFVATEEEDLGDLKESWTATGSRAEIMKHFDGFEETVQRTLSLLGPHPSKWLLNDRDPLEQWVWMGGKVVLMGDAAHAMLPHQGQFREHTFKSYTLTCC